MATNLQSAFKKSVIFPFNPNVIADPQVAPSTSFNMGAGQDKSDVQTKYNTKEPLSDSVIAAEILQR